MLTTLPQITLEMDFETPAILKALAEAHRYLGELKGVSVSIPNEQILIDLLFNIPVIRRGNTTEDREGRGGDE